MSELKKMRSRLVAIGVLQNKLSRQRDELVKKMQKQCKHPLIIETDYVPNDYGNATPPSRMCIICTLDEEGWGCGYKKLNVDKPFKIVSRDEFYEYMVFKPLVPVVA